MFLRLTIGDLVRRHLSRFTSRFAIHGIVGTIVAFVLLSCNAGVDDLATSPFQEYFGTQRTELSESAFISGVETILSEKKVQEKSKSSLPTYFSVNMMGQRMPTLVDSEGNILAFFNQSRVGENMFTTIPLARGTWKEQTAHKKTIIGEFILVFKDTRWLCNVAIYHLSGEDAYLIGIEPIQQSQ